MDILTSQESEVRSQNSQVRMKAPATRFEDLMVWQKAHQFVLATYRFTRTFPRSETYGFSSQWRRAAISIAANIAEGFKRGRLPSGSVCLFSLRVLRAFAVCLCARREPVNRLLTLLADQSLRDASTPPAIYYSSSLPNSVYTSARAG